MKFSMQVSLLLAGVLAAPALADQSDFGKAHRHHGYRHARSPQSIGANATEHVPAVRPVPVAVPEAAPYPNGQGDEDGLSRHIGDCNKGCIGGNPG